MLAYLAKEEEKKRADGEQKAKEEETKAKEAAVQEKARAEKAERETLFDYRAATDGDQHEIGALPHSW